MTGGRENADTAVSWGQERVNECWDLSIRRRAGVIEFPAPGNNKREVCPTTALPPTPGYPAIPCTVADCPITQYRHSFTSQQTTTDEALRLSIAPPTFRGPQAMKQSPSTCNIAYMHSKPSQNWTGGGTMETLYKREISRNWRNL